MSSADQQQAAPALSGARNHLQAAPVRWHHKLVGMLLVILCFQVGIFLLAFPWSPYWNNNYFSWLSPAWRDLWINPYFRGAVSGLGMVNLCLSVLEVFRLQDLSAALRRGADQS